MKKIRSLIFLLTALFFSANVYAVAAESFRGDQVFSSRNFEKVSVNGNTDFKNVKLATASISGNVLFEDLVVRRSLDVKGNITGFKGNFQKLHAIGNADLIDVRVEYLDITGPTAIKNSTVKSIHVVGSLEVTNTTVGTVNVNTSSVILRDSKANSIRVKKDPNIEQKLVLNNSSVGDVIFDSGNGQIYVIGNAEITGKVTGATIIKE